MDADNEEDSQSNDQPQSDWKFNPNGSNDSPDKKVPTVSKFKPITWKSSEFIHHEKSSAWYMALVLVTVVLATVSFLLIRDIVSTIVIVTVAIIFGYMAGRKPKEIEYTLDNNGIKIENTTRSFKDFKSYAVIDEGSLTEIVFVPMQRFIPPLSIFSPADEAQIITEIISGYLPQDQKHGNDIIDHFIRRIKF